MPIALSPDTTLTAYAVEVDENTAQVISCPHCVSSSIVMKSTTLSVQKEGNILAECLAIPLRCQDCGTEWHLEFVAHSGKNQKPLDLVMQVAKVA
jgi:hypothetical protein